MDHAEATATHATDRYLLGELTAAEADAFEDHYFDCVDCADELRIGLRFMNGGRGIAREAAAPVEAPPVVRFQPRPRRTAWVPAAVAAALVLAVGAPILMKQRSASGPSFEVAKVYSLLLQDSRGAADVPTLNASETSVLVFDVPSEPTYSSYEARLRQPDGTIRTLPFTPDPKDEPTQLKVSGLSAGRHELMIVGMDPAGQHAVIRSYSLNVR